MKGSLASPRKKASNIAENKIITQKNKRICEGSRDNERAAETENTLFFIFLEIQEKVL